MMTKDTISTHQQNFLDSFGAEVRAFRTAAGMTQAEVSSWMDWNRDALSKIETGRNNISVYDYLKIMNFLRDAVPVDHPALALADRFLPRPGRKS
jgi:transcriptional regulator with XRE-family HTH domain